MTPPFSAEQFFAVFVAYHEAVWPAQVLLAGLALATVVLSFVRPSWHGQAIAGILAGLWIWMGIAYHWLFFAEVNPAARMFGALFVLEGALLAWIGLRGEGLTFRPTADLFGWVGGALVLYALVVYPLLGITMGHIYPAQPTFGLPCPTTIFTFGVLLWGRPRVPAGILVIPALWTIVGASAVLHFGVLEDAMLPVAGIVATALILWKNRVGPIPATEASRSGASSKPTASPR
jgi:hypothetical protein